MTIKIKANANNKKYILIKLKKILIILDLCLLTCRFDLKIPNNGYKAEILSKM